MTDGPAAGPAVRPAFHGTAGSMFPVVFKGLFLTVLTLGIYRFWYITNVRRFLWNETEVESDYVEYTGRGVELFVGFLIAVAVLIPVYGALFLIGLVTGPIGAAVLQFGSTFGLLFLAQYALYRARRYRLTRTVWRGIRFQQSGSGWAYAAKSFGWALAAILTLGLAYPWMRASLERYKMTHTWYGDQQGAFSATGGQFFRRGALLWVIALLCLVIPTVVAVGLGSQLPEFGADPIPASTKLAIGAAPVSGLLVLLVIAPVFMAIEYRWWANGCGVGPATARCDLGLFGFFKVYLGYVGVVLLCGVVLALVATLAGYVLKTSGMLESTAAFLAQISLIVVGAAVYFVVALIFAALWQLFGVRPIWRKSVESVEIAGLGALMAAQSGEPPANAFGEGVADALDFGGF